MRQAKWLVGCAVAITVFGALVPAARADLKMEQTLMTSGDTDEDGNVLKDQTKVRTVYLKAGKRREDSNGVITIFDFTANKRLVLNAKDKTYYEMSLVEWLAGDPPPMELAVHGPIVVTDTKEEKQIAGKTAHHYKFSVTIGTKNATDSEVAQLAPEFVVSGEQWTIRYKGDTEQVKTAGYDSEPLPPGMSTSLLKLGKALKPVAEKFSLIKGVPFEGVTIMNVRVKDSAPAELKAQMPGTRTETIKTTSWSEEALPASTFQVPVGYTKVAVPKKTTDE